MAETIRPDAVQIPHQFPREAGIPRASQPSMVMFAEQLLGVDKAAGERALCRNQGDHVFATRDDGQSLKFADNHELKGRDRYEWKDRGDGVKIGTLVEAARVVFAAARIVPPLPEAPAPPKAGGKAKA